MHTEIKPTQSITVIGDSHTMALRAAVKMHAKDDGTSLIKVLRLQHPKKEKISADISESRLFEEIANATPDSAFFFALRGNQYNTLGLIRHPRPYDFFDPKGVGAEPEPEAEITPYSVMHDYFSDSLRRGYGRILAKAAKISQCRLFCLSSPAPKEDAVHIMRYAESFFSAAGISEIGVSPAPLRLRLWTLQNRVLETYCNELGIRFLWNPEGTRDEKGYLRREYYANDATHGNAAYGALVLQQIMAALDTPASEGIPASAERSEPRLRPQRSV